MAKIIYPEAKYFKEIADSLSKLIDEVAIQLKPDGLLITALDPAKVALINIYLPQAVFSEYDVSEEVVVGLSTSILSKILRKIKKGDRLVLSASEDRVEVVIESIGRRIYRLRNLEVPVPEVPEAELEFKVYTQLLVEPIRQIVRDAETIGDILEVEAPDTQTLCLRGKGVSIAETKLTIGMPALISLEVKEPSKSSYQIEYLKHIIGLTKVAESVVLKFSSNSPIEFEFTMGEARINYLLAPTITE